MSSIESGPAEVLPDLSPTRTEAYLDIDIEDELSIIVEEQEPSPERSSQEAAEIYRQLEELRHDGHEMVDRLFDLLDALGRQILSPDQGHGENDALSSSIERLAHLLNAFHDLHAGRQSPDSAGRRDE